MTAGDPEGVGEEPVCAALSSRNLTSTDLGANPFFRCEKPATNRLRYGTALCNRTKCPDNFWVSDNISRPFQNFKDRCTNACLVSEGLRCISLRTGSYSFAVTILGCYEACIHTHTCLEFWNSGVNKVTWAERPRFDSWRQGYFFPPSRPHRLWSPFSVQKIHAVNRPGRESEHSRLSLFWFSTISWCDV